jgi:hypothetical protein
MFERASLDFKTRSQDRLLTASIEAVWFVERLLYSVIELKAPEKCLTVAIDKRSIGGTNYGSYKPLSAELQ